MANVVEADVPHDARAHEGSVTGLAPVVNAVKMPLPVVRALPHGVPERHRDLGEPDLVLVAELRLPENLALRVARRAELQAPVVEAEVLGPQVVGLSPPKLCESRPGLGRDEAIRPHMSANVGLELVIRTIVASAARGDRQRDALGRLCQGERRAGTHLVESRDDVEEPEDDLPARLHLVELEDK